MLRYVKICPRCHCLNDENAADCSECPESLFGILAEPEPPSAAPSSPPAQTPRVSMPPSAVAQTSPLPADKGFAAFEAPVTRRMDGGGMLTLMHPGSGRSFNVAPGAVVGMDHHTGEAQVKINGMADYDLIHRQHCHFILRAGQWLVQPIDQRQFRPDKTTNPTFVNQVFVPPGAEQPVRSGDQITLAKVTFNILLLG